MKLTRRCRRLSARPDSNRALIASLAGLLLLCFSSGMPVEGAEIPTRDLEAMRALAFRLMWLEDYERSIEVYREIARQMPNDPKSHYDLAGTLSFLRLYEEAVEPAETAIRLDPDNVRTQEMAAMIYLNLRRYEKAFAATLKCAELGEATAMYTLVNLYEKGLGVTADQDQAVYWAERAAEQGHLGAMAIMEEAYRTGRLGRPIDPRLADKWAKRLRDTE
jgi:TPR repeat protein